MKVKSNHIAFLKVLCPDGAPDMEEIYKEVRDVGFKEIRPYEEYTPNDWDHRFIIWRCNGEDKLTDEEGINLVGKDGNIMYLWRCPRCGCVVRKVEYPCNHEEDGYFGCSCPGTTWGYPIC